MIRALIVDDNLGDVELCNCVDCEEGAIPGNYTWSVLIQARWFFIWWDWIRQVSGVDRVAATALIAAVGNASAFQKGGNLAAWMRSVPGEDPAGGKQKLLGVSKRGNGYVRTLFIQARKLNRSMQHHLRG
jgi:Transposase IS116/IS110/IS902 family